MAERRPGPAGQPRAFITAAGALLFGGLFAGVVFLNRANSPPPPASAASSASASPPPSSTAPTATPTPAVASIPFADCTSATFGPPLAASGEPPSPHVYAAAPAIQIDAAKLYEATITTARGTIVLCLQPTLAPVTVNNFVTLARNHFYDGLTFHRVVAGFVVQGGDPSGNGSGGPGYKFNDEPVREQYVQGAVAMANSGVNTNGSQFFICSADDTAKLQPLYNLFGRVASGLNVALSIQQGDVMSHVTVAAQR